MAHIPAPHDPGDILTKQKKHRQPTERSRSGCVICRIRKIKCDRKRPYCEQCTSTGRHCKGLAAQGLRFVHEEGTKLVGRDKSVSPHSTLRPNPALHESRELRAFYVFLDIAAPTLSGVFDTGFWSQLVPQISHIEPAIYYALLTIGQLFDTPVRPEDKRRLARENVPANQLQAFRWYSTAVGDLQQAMNRGPQNIALALLSCTLFICVEYQLHNTSCAVLLLQKGITLLETAMDGKHVPSDLTSSEILDSVLPFFSQQAMIGATFGQPPPAGWKLDVSALENVEQTRSSFETMNEAQVSLYSLMCRGNAFVRIAWLLNTHPLLALSLVAEQQEMMTRVNEWRANYFRLCESANGVIGANPAVANYLLMYQSVLKVWIATCTSPFQTVFDAHLPSFEEILQCAEMIISMMPHEREIRSPFAAGMGIVPPLFFVAVKCRHRILRRKACVLLESTRHVEGIWKVLPTVQVVRKVIQLEEEAVTEFSSTSPDAYQMPEEAKRIHHLEVIPRDLSKPISNLSIRVLRISWDAMGQRQTEQVVITLESLHCVVLHTAATQS